MNIISCNHEYPVLIVLKNGVVSVLLVSDQHPYLYPAFKHALTNPNSLSVALTDLVLVVISLKIPEIKRSRWGLYNCP